MIIHRKGILHRQDCLCSINKLYQAQTTLQPTNLLINYSINQPINSINQ